MPYIPLVNLRRQYRSLAPEIDRALLDVCSRADFVLGDAVERFETAFARYLGVKHCVGVNSGTDALHLILRALGIGPGDEVILPANTFIATAQAAWCCGATPVLVDCNDETATIDPARVAAAITSRTKAIMPVHLYGQPADLDPLLALAGPRGIHVIEDAAQAHGASYRGRSCGTIGVAAGFSFYPGKNLGAYGDGGAVTTNDDRLAAEVRLLRNLGSAVKYVHTRIGFNSRLDAMQAAVLSVKLPHLDEWNARRNHIADRYRAALARSADRLRPLGVAASTTRHAYHLFVVRSLDGQRDRIVRALQARDIGVAIHYPIPIHRQDGFKPLLALSDGGPGWPVTDRLSGEIFSLPLCADLTDDEVETVLGELEDVLDGPDAEPATTAVRLGPVTRHRHGR